MQEIVLNAEQFKDLVRGAHVKQVVGNEEVWIRSDPSPHVMMQVMADVAPEIFKHVASRLNEDKSLEDRINKALFDK